jgi:PAS domain S-box-containing protein
MVWRGKSVTVQYDGELQNMKLCRAVVAQAPDAVILANRDGAIELWNGAAERLFGYSSAEVIGKSLDVIIPERLRTAHWAGFQKAIESGHGKYAPGQVLTTRSMHKDGRKLYVDLSFALVRDDAGAITGAMAIGRDCTDRYLSDRALRERISELERTLHDKNHESSDEQIRTYLRQHLVHASHYPALLDVTFEVRDGSVTLSGSVPHRGVKHSLEETAATCPGVRHVENKLNVALTAPWPDPLALSTRDQG